MAALAIAPASQPVPLVALNPVLYAGWLVEAPPLQARRLLPPSITAVQVDNPPPKSAWQFYAYPETLSAIQPRLGSPALLAPSASFSTPLAAVLSPVYAAWLALDLAYPQPVRLLPPALTAVRVDNPPLLRAAWSGYGAWVSDFPAQQRAVQFVPAAPVSSGQPFSNAALSPVYAAWQLLDLSYPQARRLLPPSIVDVKVDSPPPSRPPSALWSVWNAEAPPQQALARAVPQSVTADIPPGDRRLWMASVSAIWSIPDPPQHARRVLNPALLHVRVDNPPPRARNDVLTAYLSWDFPPPPIRAARYGIPISGAPALVALPPYVVVAKQLLYSAKLLLGYSAVVPDLNYTATPFLAYASVISWANYTALAIGNNMPAAKDFPPIDALTQKQTVAFDFGAILPAGVVLNGSPIAPTVTVTVHDGTDATPQNRVTSGPSIGTQPVAQGGTGLANTAVLVQLGTMLGGVTYLVVCSCSASNGDVMSGWNRVRCLTPT